MSLAGSCSPVLSFYIPGSPLHVLNLVSLGSLAFRRSASFRCLYQLLRLGQSLLQQDCSVYSRLRYNTLLGPLSGCLRRPSSSLYRLTQPCSWRGLLMQALPVGLCLCPSEVFFDHDTWPGYPLHLLWGPSVFSPSHLTSRSLVPPLGFWALPDPFGVFVTPGPSLCSARSCLRQSQIFFHRISLLFPVSTKSTSSFGTCRLFSVWSSLSRALPSSVPLALSPIRYIAACYVSLLLHCILHCGSVVGSWSSVISWSTLRLSRRLLTLVRPRTCATPALSRTSLGMRPSCHLSHSRLTLGSCGSSASGGCPLRRAPSAAPLLSRAMRLLL